MSLDDFNKYSTYKEEITTNNSVWVYTRVSSKDQFETNNSIENQKRSSENYAEGKYDITKTFGGTYESASGDFTRKEFKKLIEAVKVSRKRPFAIMIFKMSRFSRTGGGAVGLVNELVHSLGVHLIEVSTGKNTTTARGELEIEESLLYARKENIERLEITLPGMIALIEKGNVLGQAPRGYDLYGPRVSNPAFVAGTQKVVVNKEGRLLKKAWGWKLSGIPDFEIKTKLEILGLKVTKQFLSSMWRRPFYCGISTHSFLKGKSTKGNWEPIVTQKDFISLNKELSAKTNSGYKQSKQSIERPLQGSLFCGACGTKFTGYLAKKKFSYYKCQNSKCSCKDMNADTTVRSAQKGLNDLFGEYLSEFQLDETRLSAFKAQMRNTIIEKEKEFFEVQPFLSAKIKKVQEKIKTLEKKRIFDSLDEGLYNEFKTELQDELACLNNEMAKVSEPISNLDKKIDYCSEVVLNISNNWRLGGFETKVMIQKLVFPQGIVISPQNRQYRTKEINAVFLQGAVLSRESKEQKKDASDVKSDASCLVAGTGLEPMTFGL
jgi:site-specific DNA recombinase